VWAQVKQKSQETFNVSNMERLVNKRLDNVAQEDRAACVHRTIKLQEDDFAKELGCDEIL
jgi:hypothetical protein